MKKLLVLLLALAMVFAFAACSDDTATDNTGDTNTGDNTGDEAVDPIALSVSTTQIQGSIMSDSMEKWLDELEARTDGKVVVDQVVYGGTLIAAADQLTGLGAGVADISFFSTTATSEQLPLSNALIPSYLTNFQGGIAAMNEVYANYDNVREEIEQYNITNLFWLNGNQQAIMTNWEIDIMSDKPFNNKNMFSAGTNPHHFCQNLGGIPVTMTIADIYSGMQKGTTDGITVCGGYSLESNAFYEVVDYVYDHRNCGTGLWIGFNMNTDTYNSLPDDVKAVIEELRTWIIDIDNQHWIDYTNSAYDLAVENGATLIQLTEEEAAHWNDLAQPESMWEANLVKAEAAGHDNVREIMDFLKGELLAYQEAHPQTLMEAYFEYAESK